MAEWITLCSADEITEGMREVFSVGNHWIAVFCVSNRYYAIEDICTHDGNTLTEDSQGRAVPLVEHTIQCPRHGAVFDIRDGKFQRGPAGTINLPFYPVRIEAGQLQIEMK